MVKKKSSRFEYRPREKDAVKKRANQSGGLFDSIFKSQFVTFTPKEGAYSLRILPPTWDDAQHFGLDIYVHYQVGSDNQSYLCLDKMQGEACPICEQRKVAERSGDAEYARSLQPTKRVLVWIVNRADEEAGPQLWSMAWTIDRDFANLSIDKASGELLLIDDPEDGYDVEFVRTGKGLKTKYSGTAVSRRSSPLADDPKDLDAWLAFVNENPLPDVLQYFDSDHITSIAEAKGGTDDDDDGDAPSTRSKSKRRAKLKPGDEDDEEDEDEEDDLPPRRKSKPVDEDAEEDEDDEYDCMACSDTGRNSKGGYCVCARGRKLQVKASVDDYDDDAPTRRSKRRKARE